MKKHILVISQYFYPEQFRINDICEEWVKRGNQVTVVTGIPNYPQGKFFDGYGLLSGRKEEYKGINIIRIPIIARGQSPIQLLLNYISFVISGFFWKTFTAVKANQVFIFEVSPMTQALVGVWYAKRKKIPCYIYVQDLWPENVEIVAGIHNKRIIKAIDRMVDYIYKNCQKIFATSPSFVECIKKRPMLHGICENKVLYWPQYAEEFYQPVEKAPLEFMEESEHFKVIFTGNIGYAQGLDILPKAAAVLKKKKISCKFYIIGDGRYKHEFEMNILEYQVEEMFCMLGRKEPRDIPAYMAHCDAAFLSFADNPLFEKTIPAKLQSYMACGVPILAVATGETRKIIEDAGCGYCCGFNNIEQVVENIEKLRESSAEEKCNMRKNALEYCKINFNKANLMDEIEKQIFEMGGK